MGEMTDKLKATANRAAGSIREDAGKATGNAALETKGDAQKLGGAGQDGKESVKGALGDNI